MLVLAGPAGSGKSTLCDRFVKDHPDVRRVVTSTTRAPRPGEINGVHYYFFTPGDFDKAVAEGRFLEWAWVHKKHRYGTLLSSVMEPLSQGNSLIINIDVQGVENFRKAAEGNALLRQALCTVFIKLNIPELRKRMIGRGQDSLEEIECRLKTAEAELKEASKFDHIIQSKTKDEDYEALLRIYEIKRSIRLA